MASDNYSASAGPIAAVVNAAWATASRAPSALDWLPAPTTPLYHGGPLMNPVWYRFLRMLAEKVGGIAGPSVTEVVSSIEAVQNQVVEASAAAQAAAAQTTANTQSIDVIREVAITAGLPGAGQIP